MKQASDSSLDANSQSAVSLTIDSLGRAVSDLSKVVTNLHDRLEPVLQVPPPSDNGPEVKGEIKDGRSSPIVRSLEELRCDLVRIHERVSRTLELLEV